MAKPKFKSPLAAAWEEMNRKAQAERAARGSSKPKKAPKRIDDAVFGALALVGADLYERDFQIELFGKKRRVRLQVQICPQQGLEQRQIRAFEQFAQHSPRMLAEAEKKMFAYYQSVCHEYRSDQGITAAKDRRVPLVKNAAELARLVRPEAMYFPYVRSRPTCGLLCQCTWEDEHGLAVKFENGKVTEVGFQDIVL
jgi:hypothetical protein